MESFGRFRILSQLGRGLATTVHQAIDPTDGRKIALKLFRLELRPGTPEATAWEERFRRETRNAMQLVHPAAVRTWEADILDGRPYVALEFVEGRTLADALRVNSLDLGRKVDVAIEIADALIAAHAIGVLHQSLRPANVLLETQGAVKVADFGGLDLLAAAASSVNASGPPERMHYRAPEEIYGRRTDERTDLFALGVLLYEMAFRRRPFDGDSSFQVTQRILNAPPPYLRDSSGELPIALVKILDRALAKDPLDRYQSARDVKRDLLGLKDALNAASTGDFGPAVRPGIQESPTVCLSAPGPGAVLVIEEGEERRSLPINGELTIGRRSENQLTFADESVSRYHAKIVTTGEGFELVDRRSRHGTFLNGEKITRSELRDGDHIELGHYRRARITFRLGTASGPAPVPEPVYREHELVYLLELGRTLNSTLSLDAVLNVILDSALEFTGAERGFILLREESGRLRVGRGRYQSAKDLSPGEESVSMSVVDRCVESEQPVIIHDVDQELEIARQDSILALHLKSILCLPLLSKGALLGVLYLDSRELKEPFAPRRLRVLQSFAEFAAIALENARLHDMVIVDPLTQLYRRDYFFLRLEQEFQRALRHDSPLALVFADIDNFKFVNDTFGHPAGDEVLRAMGALFRRTARSTDIVGRYGGEELVLLALETALEDAAAMAERIREATRRIHLPMPGGASRSVTLSLGVAAWPGPGIDCSADLVGAADAALLLAKKRGRDQVVIASHDQA